MAVRKWYVKHLSRSLTTVFNNWWLFSPQKIREETWMWRQGEMVTLEVWERGWAGKE